MSDFKKITQVKFTLRENAPINLKDKVYLIDTKNFNIAAKESREYLRKDLCQLAASYKVSNDELMGYYDNIIMGWIDLRGVL